jgi:hypothetical protein
MDRVARLRGAILQASETLDGGFSDKPHQIYMALADQMRPAEAEARKALTDMIASELGHRP